MNIGRENESTEFKSSLTQIKEGVISIASILNKHKEGTIYFGVRDDGEICGITIGKDSERKISMEISNRIYPKCMYEINTNTTIDGQIFIEVNFSGDTPPYSAYDKYYQRFSDEDKKMEISELERLLRTRQKNYSSWEKKLTEEGVKNCNSDLIKQCYNNAKNLSRIKADYKSPENFLSKMGLYDISKGKLNNAGRVLFSKNEPVLLKLAQYATDTRDTFVSLNHFYGNIFECIDEGINFVIPKLDWDINFTGNAKRIEEPEIPTNALREIIVNAFAHGSYDDITNFKIEVYKNRVEIYSPGFFPIGYTPEDFATKSVEPILLNPKISNTLFMSGKIEAFGSGFGRVFTLCKKANVKYKYNITKTGFRFTFFRKNYKEKDIYTKSEKAVLEIITQNRNLSVKEIAKKINKSEKTVYRALEKFKQNQLIFADSIIFKDQIE